MKTKLTLTVQKNIIDSAKRIAKRRRMSLSQLFEVVFDNDEVVQIKSESQKAAERLLSKLSTSAEIDSLDDDKELKKHVARKFA